MTLPHPHHSAPLVLGFLALLTVASFSLTPNEWRASQSLDVPAPRLVSINLPDATLDASRFNLEDLRVVDPAGNEVPFLIDRTAPQPGSMLNPVEFRSTLEAEETRLTIRTGTKEMLAEISLQTPAREFLKAARIEGSHTGDNWQELASGQPVFRLNSGASNLQLSFPAGTWEYLRISLDDRRAQPVPFTSAQLFTMGKPSPATSHPIAIKSRDESPGVTRLSLDLGAANLHIASLRLETAAPLFTRTVTLAAPKVTEDGVREEAIGECVIYRVDVGGKSASLLSIAIERQIASRELILLIHNLDSPPLAIDKVEGQKRPARLIFLAGERGTYRMLSGNSQCDAPHYDLAGLSSQLKNAAATEVVASPLISNAAYQPPDALASLTLHGVGLDTADWKFRKPVKLGRGSVQQLELDLDVLARAQPDLRDVRIVRDGKQIPYLLQPTSISREVPLSATLTADPNRPTLTRWSLKLPQARLPITSLCCASGSALFQREMRLWEEMPVGRGGKSAHDLGRAHWNQTPQQPLQQFTISLNHSPLSDTLVIETDNGDNPAIELYDFRFYYPVTRVVFKADPDSVQPAFIHYGNPKAMFPRYDLNLVASQLLRAEPSIATTESELSSNPVIEEPVAKPSGYLRYVFWAVLAFVVIVLLALMARLVPKSGDVK